MPTPTYTPLANITLGSSAASVTFSSISQAYRDLVLVVEAKATTGNSYLFTTFNNDSGSNYNVVTMTGDGSTAGSNSGNDTRFNITQSFNITATDVGQFILNLQDYSVTDKHKSILWRYNKPAAVTIAGAGRWASTSAVTSIKIEAFYNAYEVGSTFSLFGIAS